MFEHEERELLDVVNEHDEVIDVIHRSEFGSLQNALGHYIRFVEIFVQRPDGDIYLPRRSPHKKIAPGGLDISAAGHVESGESYAAAGIRELQEETSIEASADDLESITKVNATPDAPYFRQVYLLRTDQNPTLSPEHTEAIWIAPENLEEYVRNDAPTKETLYENIPLLVTYLEKNPINE